MFAGDMSRLAALGRVAARRQAGLVLVCFVALSVAEQLLPLRASREPKARRWARNLVLAGLGAVVQSFEHSLTRRLAAPARRPRLEQPARAMHALLGVLGLDYTLYLWHRLTHQVPFLWRFHAVHHADLDLDATTALRFHVGELASSIPWRLAQVEFFGLSPRVLNGWRTALSVSVLFQHSNLRLPQRVERVLGYLIVTPRLHGIHHCTRASERNNNWSSGLTIWDRWHHTFRDDVGQSEIEIGIPEARGPAQVTLAKLLLARVIPRQKPESGAGG